VEAAGGQALAVTGDVAVEADVQRMIAEGMRRFGALHILHNNAGVLWKDRDRSVLETDGTWWDRVMAINLKSVFWVTKHGIPLLRAAGGGSIIMMGSVSALAGFTRAQDAYTAAKGALISLTKSLAIQFAKDRIRCNVIHPGIVDTPLQAPYLTEAIRKEFETGIPLARDRVRGAVPGERRVLVHDRRRAGRRRRLHGRLRPWPPSPACRRRRRCASPARTWPWPAPPPSCSRCSSPSSSGRSPACWC
jgi:NAD(P)-dependent dehydrogenase (short-subunit alcohol dehydrogenase family)